MIDQETFLKQYNLDTEDLRKAALSWEELAAIHEDYLKKELPCGDRKGIC